MGATEPTDRAALLRSFSAPSPCQQERGAEHWPINLHGPCAEVEGWSFIIGIEDGWFSYDRSGHLQWSGYGERRVGKRVAVSVVLGGRSYIETKTCIDTIY